MKLGAGFAQALGVVLYLLAALAAAGAFLGFGETLGKDDRGASFAWLAGGVGVTLVLVTLGALARLVGRFVAAWVDEQ